jgi:hypothetical protein
MKMLDNFYELLSQYAMEVWSYKDKTPVRSGALVCIHKLDNNNHYWDKELMNTTFVFNDDLEVVDFLTKLLKEWKTNKSYSLRLQGFTSLAKAEGIQYKRGYFRTTIDEFGINLSHTVDKKEILKDTKWSKDIAFKTGTDTI